MISNKRFSIVVSIFWIALMACSCNHDASSRKITQGQLDGDSSHCYAMNDLTSHLDCAKDSSAMVWGKDKAGVDQVDEEGQGHAESLAQKNEALKKTLVVIAVLLILAIIQFILVWRQYRRIRKSRLELQVYNDKLKTINTQQENANYIKGKYIGLTFNICSNYIEKMERYRTSIRAKLSSKKYNDIMEMVASDDLAKEEQKKFLQTFDELFLKIYPNFVTDINSLLLPEEQLALPKSKPLNTDLRIQALVWLGFTESGKIAEFFHCSLGAIYNSRAHMRAKCKYGKDKFDAMVTTLNRNVSLHDTDE